MESKNLCPATTATIFACYSIATSFTENIYELAHIRKEWTVAYAQTLRNEAKGVVDKLVATGNIKNIMDKLTIWRELMISSLTNIGIIRASVKNDFKNDKQFQREFYQQLGYNDYFSDAKNGDHYSMFSFIKTFAENLTPEIRDKILAGGLDPHIVDTLIENARQLDNFGECFAFMKDTISISPEDQEIIDKLYSDIRDICRIATAYYYFDPQKREAFNFFKALRNLR
jgi:hypothetical protein